MADEVFNVVTQGLAAGAHDDGDCTALQRLQRQLQLSEAAARRLLSEQPVVVKKAVARDLAEAYRQRLIALGLSARVEPAASPDQPPDAEAPWFSPCGMRRSTGFLWALSGVTVRILALALTYIALALGATCLLLYYLWHFGYLLSAPPVLFSATIYLLTSTALAILTALLWRPLLPLPAPPSAALSVDARMQPGLHRFIGQLSDALGLRAPTALFIDTGVTIAITPQRGAAGFRQGDYALTLGLPLLRCFSARACAGLLAAALGPVAHPWTLRSLRLLDAIQRRFDACAAGKDLLFATMRGSDVPPHRPARIALWVLRASNRALAPLAARIAALRARLAHALQREADRYHVRVAGTQAFAATLRALPLLAASRRRAALKNFDERFGGALVADFPALVQHYFQHHYGNRDDYRGDHDNRGSRESADAADGPWYRPAQPDDGAPVAARLEQVGAAQPGHMIRDGAMVLAEADAVAAQSTRLLYRQARIPADVDISVPADKAAYAVGEELGRQRRAAHYFNGWFHPHRFWNPPDRELVRTLPLADAAQQLSVCVSEIRRLTPDRQRLFADYTLLSNQIREILLAQQLPASGSGFQFRYLPRDPGALAPLLESKQRQLDQVTAQLALQETLMGGRIALGLRLCGQAAEDVADLHEALAGLQPLGPRLYRFALDVHQLEQLSQRSRAGSGAALRLAVAGLEQRIADAGASLLQRLNGIPFPPERRRGSLGKYLEQRLRRSQEHDPGGPLERARALLQGIEAANERLTLLAADYGSSAEDAYKIERIRLIAPGRGRRRAGRPGTAGQGRAGGRQDGNRGQERRAQDRTGPGKGRGQDREGARESGGQDRPRHQKSGR